MRIYDQNIWGNFDPAAGHCIANRNLLIKEMVYENMPDFCCFQECNPQTSRSGDTPIQDLLKEDYKEAAPTEAHRNFTPVFYNFKTVDLIESGFFPYSGFNDMDSKSATWGVFKSKETNQIVSVISTHFWWKDESEADNLQRMQNAADVVAKADEIFKKYNCPVFVTGDLNSGDTKQGTGGYDKMVELNMVDIRSIAKETDYSYTCSSGAISYPYPEFKDGKFQNGVEANCIIDYLFTYTPDLIDAKSFKVINSEKARTSSDHSPLLLDFEII